jgi:hypothetical protein
MISDVPLSGHDFQCKTTKCRCIPNALQVPYVIQATTIDGHWNVFCRVTMLSFRSHQASQCKGAKKRPHMATAQQT